uniref:Troponin T n=1 Tax=Heterorhabditis bacteriophora TaxID=37862 RepID=A0A1I7XL22_HETBA
MMGGSFPSGQGGRNFTIPTKTEKNDKFGNIVQAKQEMGMTKEQQEETKKAFMIGVKNGILTSSSILPADLKAKIKELHQRICKLETDKYDLEKRHERQEYDLKELNERSRQVARNAALKKGIDPTDAGDSRHPPKVQVFSKYDRQIDRRNFGERRAVYENKNAYPCFPGIAPPPALYEKVIAKYAHEIQEEEDADDMEEEYE